jgi:hypothetical protein
MKPGTKAGTTLIENIYGKLGELLSETEFTTSAAVIEGFEKRFPSDWGTIVERFGHRDDVPGKKNRSQHYAASTYIADRLAAMKRMGLVELRHTQEGFDPAVWRHNRRMGTWRLIRRPEHGGDWRFLTVRIPGGAYEKLAAEAHDAQTSIAALAAARGTRVCVRHLGMYLRELECLAEVLRAPQLNSAAVIQSRDAVDDAHRELKRCPDCWARYAEVRAVADAAARRRAAASPAA